MSKREEKDFVLEFLDKQIIISPNDIEFLTIGYSGRGQSGSEIANWCDEWDLKNNFIFSKTPKHRQWYPMPNGPSDQADSLKALPKSVESANSLHDLALSKIGNPAGVKKVIYAGYSAGGVIAIENAIANKRCDVCVIYAGAILEPKNLPKADEKTKNIKFLWFHADDDSVFEIRERVAPSYYALKEKGYDVSIFLRDGGDHFFGSIDHYYVSHILNERIGLPSPQISEKLLRRSRYREVE